MIPIIIMTITMYILIIKVILMKMIIIINIFIMVIIIIQYYYPLSGGGVISSPILLLNQNSEPGLTMFERSPLHRFIRYHVCIRETKVHRNCNVRQQSTTSWNECVVECTGLEKITAPEKSQRCNSGKRKSDSYSTPP